MKKHYETHVEDTDKLISVAGPVLDYKSWYEQYRKLMEEQAQRKYGLYTPTSEGDDDDFPNIPGMIARWSAKGLTNEDMSTNPVWKDLTGNGYDLQMKNFGWARMSGVGGYADNFSSESWKKPSDRSDITWTSSSFNITRVMNTGVQMYYQAAWEESESVIPEKRIIVKGLEDGQVLRYMNVGNRIIEISQDGIYTIPSFIFKGVSSYHGYSLAKKQESCNVTIEQLPLYPGFILGDGVDDFAVTEKELNFEDTYTVYTAFIPLQNDPIKNMIVCGKDYKKDFYINYGTQLVFYTANSTKSIPLHINQFTVLLCKRDKTTGVIKNLVTGESFQFSVSQLISNPGLYYLWRSATVFSYGKTAIAGQTICNGYFSTDEDDQKVLNWYKKQYPWLFPDQAWTVTGKTNEDKDRATIANITGNGNDLVLSNFGFAEGSGYNEEGEYAGYLVTDGVDDKIVSSVFGMGKDFTIVGDWKFIDNKKSGTGLVKGSSFYIYNTMIGLDLYINSGSVKNSLDGIKSINAACSDGRAYDRNWNEILANTGNVVGSGGTLEVSSSGGRFDRIAFKNLAIYPRILSKDDCIKAYNYLQSLKAK